MASIDACQNNVGGELELEINRPSQSVERGAWTEIGMAAGIDGRGYMAGGATNSIVVGALASLTA